MPFALPRRAAFASALLVAALAACSAPPRPVGAGNEHLVTGRLHAVRPIEVVVPPVENHTGLASLPLDTMRAEIQKGLVRRRYSPLSLSLVDKHVAAAEASYQPGALGEQAVLRVVLTGWDTSHWRSHARLVIDADVNLLDAAAPELSQSLWGGHATRTIDLSLQRDTFIDEHAMEKRAVEVFVEEVLASLPARNAETGGG